MQKILLVFMVVILSICCSGCFGGIDGEISREYSEEYSNIPLKNFIPSEEEFKTLYNNSGMPTMSEGKEFVQWNSSQYMIYRSENAYSSNYEACWLNLKEFSVSHSHKTGTKQSIEYMTKPVLLYIQDIPGAILDTNELVAEWDKVEGVDAKTAGGTKFEFTRDGITYTKTVYLKKVYNGAGKLVTKDDMEITITCDPEYTFDLNNYSVKYISKIKN